MAVPAPNLASRLAPSPTGPLHVGNACSFLVNWALARAQGWRLHLRVEDLDAARVTAAAAHTELDLRWLGVEWDGPAVRQSERMPCYERAMRTLAEAGVVYESAHSRSEVRDAAAALSAPHEDAEADSRPDATAPNHTPADRAAPSRATSQAHTANRATPDLPATDRAAPFPRSLRPPPGACWGFRGAAVNHRFRVEPESVVVHDELLGVRTLHPAATDGDFIVWTKSGVPAYQLAVAVDDALQGVTDVVRGADLLPSAALQTLVYRALGAAPPRWWHVPLVVDADGRRLAKRRGDLSLAALREAGVPAERVVGLIAWWTGAQERLAPMHAAAFREVLEPSMLRAWSARAATRPPALDQEAIAWLTERPSIPSR